MSVVPPLNENTACLSLAQCQARPYAALRGLTIPELSSVGRVPTDWSSLKGVFIATGVQSDISIYIYFFFATYTDIINVIVGSWGR